MEQVDITVSATHTPKRVCVARVTRDRAVVTGVGVELEELRLAAFLTAAGLKVVPYRGKAFGRVDDIARQLARQASDTYVFTVERDTLSTTRRLIQHLRQLRPNTVCLLWGEAVVDGSLTAREEGGAVVLPYATSEDVARALVRSAKLHAPDADEKADRAFSPYLSGLAQSADLLRFGVTLDQSAETLEAELQWIASAHGAQADVVLLRTRACDPERLRQACEVVRAHRPGVRFRLCAPASALHTALEPLLAEAGIGAIEAHGQLASEGWSLPIEVVADDAAARAQQAARLGINGVFALSSGLYADRAAGPGILHLEVSPEVSSEVRAHTFDKLRDSMLLRSAAVLTGDTTGVKELAASFRTEWPRHLYTIRRDADTGRATAAFGTAGVQRELHYVPYSKLRSQPVRPDTTYIATVREQADADALERQLRRLHESGVIEVPPVTMPIMHENTCRWLGAGACSLNLLRRLTIQQDGTLLSCRDAGSVGKSGETFEELAQRVKREQQLEEGRRACFSCEVRDECSKCSSLPAAWAGRYCDVRKHNPQTRLFFELIEISSMAHRYLPMRDWLELGVSFTNLPARFYRGPKGRPRTDRRTVLIDAADQVLVWNRGEHGLKRISRPLALMAEGFWLGADKQDIVQALVSTFSVEPTAAAEGLDSGLDKLRSAGVIHV